MSLENQILKRNEEKVKALIDMGYSYGKIAKRFKVPKMAVKRFCDRRGWKSDYAKGNFLEVIKKWIRKFY
jgi:DNA invertase Pin-like site-specific DNA recombinase